MARIHYWQYLVDRQGRPLKDAQVRVYLAGTSIEADIYLNATFGLSTKSSSEDLKTDKFGFYQFWIGDEFEIEGGYDVDQQFKIVWQNNVDLIQEEIDNIYIFAPVRKVNLKDDIKGDPSNKDLDRVISNSLGYKWDTHVDSIVPSASPHDLEPIEFFDLDSRTNKVISNKLGYQMYQLAERASSTPIDVSAARYTSQAFTSFNFDGELYYVDFSHGYNNLYPIVKVSKISDRRQIKAEKIESINSNTVRIWLTEPINIRVIAIG